MTTYTIGQNCHLTISHPDIDAGAAFGFILGPASANELFNPPTHRKGPCVSVQREVQTDGTIHARIYFTVLLADNLVDPNGGTHPDARTTMYTKIQAFMAETSGLVVTTDIGVFSAIGALGHSATELHFGPLSVVTCMLNNVGTYYPPADPIAFSLSVWDGTLTWATSYWR